MNQLSELERRLVEAQYTPMGYNAIGRSSHPATALEAEPDMSPSLREAYANAHRDQARRGARPENLPPPRKPIPDKDLYILEKLYHNQYETSGRARGSILRMIREWRERAEPPYDEKLLTLALKRAASAKGTRIED